MTQLIEEGALRGPRSGPLQGDNQILAVDVLVVARLAPGRPTDGDRSLRHRVAVIVGESWWPCSPGGRLAYWA